jgi:putative ABC transport system permease protein
MLSDYFKIAMKSLFKRRMRSWLTMIGIFIGIAAVVSIISLGQGLENAVAQQFQALGAERIVIQAKGLGNGPPGANVAVPLTEKDLQAVRSARGVDVAVGRMIETVRIQLKTAQRYAYLASMPSNPREREFINEAANYEIEFGRDIRPGEKYKVVMGNDFISKPLLGRELKLGDTITIEGRDFEIVGFYKKSGSFQVDGTVVMNEDIAREILNEPDKYSAIMVSVVNTKDIDLTVKNIENALRRERDVKVGKENFTVQTSQQMLDSLKQILSFVTYFLIAIAGISLFVGAVGIMNTMYTAVVERTKEIGIMKAIGARNSDILKMFLIESGLLGLVGGIIGVILGMGLGKLVELIGRTILGTDLLSAAFSPQLIIGSLLFAFIVGAAAGTFPALRASKMNPVDALRKN